MPRTQGQLGDTMEFIPSCSTSRPSWPRIWGQLMVESWPGVSCEWGFSAAQGGSPRVYPSPGHSGGWAGSVLLPTAFPGQPAWTMGHSRFSPPAFLPFQDIPLFPFTNFAQQVFKIRLLMQDLVKESSNGLTGRTEEGWNIWQRREDLIPEEITKYTQLFTEAKKVG